MAKVKSMSKYKKLLVDMEGHEVWTDNLPQIREGRICVGIVLVDGVPKIMDGGVVFPLSERVAKLLWSDFIRGEYGTTDMRTILKIEGFI